MRAEGFGEEAIRLVRSADLKVAGQTYELTVRLPGPGPLTSDGLSALVDAFSPLYRERYAFFFEGEPIELVNLRVAAFGVNDPIELPSLQPHSIALPERAKAVVLSISKSWATSSPPSSNAIPCGPA